LPGTSRRLWLWVAVIVAVLVVLYFVGYLAFSLGDESPDDGLGEIID
jgi:hypothetical protein